MKEETRSEGPFEIGEYKTLNGNKNAQIVSKVVEGKTPLEMVLEGDVPYQHLKALEYLRERIIEQDIQKEEKDPDLEK